LIRHGAWNRVDFAWMPVRPKQFTESSAKAKNSSLLNKNKSEKHEVLKNVRPARPQLLGRTERTEEYVSAHEGGQGATYLRACAAKLFSS